ncbi:MAG: 3-dehydroquinate synthase [Phycisphaerales bacterium]|nr:3-dehydroquinate synthase [Phycisphaerales bacterium]
MTFPQHQYAVHVAPGLLADTGRLVREVLPHDRAAMFMDATVAPLHGPALQKSLAKAGYQVVVQNVPSGEEYKNLDTVRGMYDLMLDAKLERKSPVVALGGGVLGDTAGFVAATYLRGVPLVQVPTTLLAMVDSSVGGKVGVNVPQGKNLIGAFHQPAVVVVDPQTLLTLPMRELRCGLAECVKHGVIRRPDKFQWLSEQLEQVMCMDVETLAELVDWNVRIKADVVMKDEKETGERAHLNFGHTFGHAIEATAGYGTFHHGEAVALGMVAATTLAVNIGRCDKSVLHDLVSLLERIGLPVRAGNLPATGVLMEAMTLDKKVASGVIRLVLPVRMGEVVVVKDTPLAEIAKAWEAIR